MTDEPRVAVYFYGRINAFEYNVKSLRELQEKYNATFFCSLNKTYETLYVKTFLTTFQIGEDQYTLEETKIPDELYGCPKSPYSKYEPLYSSFYHKKRAMELIDAYQRTHAITFTKVICYRADIVPPTVLTLGDCAPNTVYIPNHGDNDPQEGQEPGINDMVAYGDFNSMKEYSSLVDYILYYCVEQKVVVHPETLVKVHLQHTGLKLVRFEFDYTLHLMRKAALPNYVEGDPEPFRDGYVKQRPLIVEPIKSSNVEHAIPRRIFQTWFTKNLDPVLAAWVKRTQDLNPGYEYSLFDDNDMEEFVVKEYPGEIAECFLRLNIAVARADFWRYLVLYKYGGVYIDMDSVVNRPLDELIRPDDEAIISTEGNPLNYVQWALMFIPGHPILKQTIDIVVDNIKTNRYPNDLGDMTGPGAYRRAIAKEAAEKGYSLVRELITCTTNETYGKGGESFRVYGVDYIPYLAWANFEIKTHMLNFRPSWPDDQRAKPLLKW